MSLVLRTVSNHGILHSKMFNEENYLLETMQTNSSGTSLITLNSRYSLFSMDSLVPGRIVEELKEKFDENPDSFVNDCNSNVNETLLYVDNCTNRKDLMAYRESLIQTLKYVTYLSNYCTFSDLHKGKSYCQGLENIRKNLSESLVIVNQNISGSRFNFQCCNCSVM